MRIRESGMPARALWEGFFNPEVIISRLGVPTNCQQLIEFGCGYGTFTIPVCQHIDGQVSALEIDENLVAQTKARASNEGVTNLAIYTIDFIAEDLPFPDGSVDFVLLFNILHGENPEILLGEAQRILRRQGAAALIHWNYDPDTPRGPPMAIRPRPEHLLASAISAGFKSSVKLDLPPYHYGFRLTKD